MFPDAFDAELQLTASEHDDGAAGGGKSFEPNGRGESSWHDGRTNGIGKSAGNAGGEIRGMVVRIYCLSHKEM